MDNTNQAHKIPRTQMESVATSESCGAGLVGGSIKIIIHVHGLAGLDTKKE